MTTMKSTILLLTLGLAVLGIWIIYSPTQNSVVECHNLFASPIYANYNQQLKTFLQKHPLYEKCRHVEETDFDKDLNSLINEIEKPKKHAHEWRAGHEAFVKQLRKLAISSASRQHSDSQLLFEEIIHWIFLRADLTSDMQNFLYRYVEPPEKDLTSYLQTAQQILHSNPLFNGATHHSYYEDQYYQGNLPSIVPSTTTKLIRMGHPLESSLPSFLWWISSPTVTPEFLLFLQLQKSHLYVNLMRRKGIEGPKTNAIESLEKQVPHLYVITLDKNSSFYKQSKDHYPEQIPSQDFIHTFLNQMTAKNGNFFWSHHLNPLSWEKELETIVNHIYRQFFNHQQTLTRAERQDFIELTYLSILDHLIEKWHPSSTNISCRQGMDRGPSLLVLWMLQKQQLSHKAIAALLLSPPLIIHNRGSFTSRIQRFVSASQQFQ